MELLPAGADTAAEWRFKIDNKVTTDTEVTVYIEATSKGRVKAYQEVKLTFKQNKAPTFPGAKPGDTIKKEKIDVEGDSQPKKDAPDEEKFYTYESVEAEDAESNEIKMEFSGAEPPCKCAKVEYEDGAKKFKVTVD
jgi:hypothetical protein